MKVWALAGNSGYVHKFSVFGDNLNTSQPQPGIGASGQVVLDLVTGENSCPSGTEIFFDNYFSSPELLLKLRDMGMHATSTMRAPRTKRCPLKSDTELKKKRGSYDFKFCNGIVVCKWYDTKSVLCASNHYSVEPLGKSRRWPITLEWEV